MHFHSKKNKKTKKNKKKTKKKRKKKTKQNKEKKVQRYVCVSYLTPSFFFFFFGFINGGLSEIFMRDELREFFEVFCSLDHD